ncbi:hypothetical protein CRM22_000420 [Opisthorchis felineus]|uniref:MD-2-related lipid-recognition domain-containing protein n=1 Tax=Opisthorchis felineus TaxID=147828 RepID=A0A4V3SH94_OPIFE|nr:hypothetical protein CRM22_000420 [Opisthorchis felineus]
MEARERHHLIRLPLNDANILVWKEITAFQIASLGSACELGSRGTVPTSVTIRPCNGEPCTVTKGTLIAVTISFMATANVTPGGALIRGTSAGAINRLPMRHNGVCGRVVPPCPIQTGETYNYYYTGQVPQSVRTGPMTIRWELLNFNGVAFLCVEFPVIIAEGS